MKRVVSISLGTSKRNKQAEASFLGERVLIERTGTDGDKDRFRSLVADLDGKVDCFGVGGMDVYVYAGDRRYAFREPLAMMRGARVTPWVDGSGLKNTLEREAVARLHADGTLDLTHKRVLLMSAVDRFGMAEALHARAREVVFGDLLFGLGLPVPIRSWAALKAIARAALPVVTQMPIEWFYPTGERQLVNRPKFRRYFERADIIAGDWHFIRRFMPERLDGKVILTTSSRASETDVLRDRGLRTLITTTPAIEGEAFATNQMQAVIVAILGRRPEQLNAADYLCALGKLGWEPSVQHLQPSG